MTDTTPRSFHRRVLAKTSVLLLATCALTSCGSTAEHPPAPGPPRTTTTSVVSSSAPLTTSSTTTAASTTTSRPPEFTWQAAPIDDRLRARMATSWRAGCPVPLESLRYITLSHWGFDGAVHAGELVVNADAVDALRQAFSSLFDQRFPIRSMRLVDDFGGDDDRSMAADNTSAFNCRRVAGSSRWSQHAFGRAVDINPVENPYLHGRVVDPPNAALFVDRTEVRPGMLVEGSPAVAAFTDLGWGWGGAWGRPDYQHVSQSGS